MQEKSILIPYKKKFPIAPAEMFRRKKDDDEDFELEDDKDFFYDRDKG